MQAFEFWTRSRVVFGNGAFDRLGDVARDLGFTRTLLVSDPGLRATGLVTRGLAQLEAAGIAGRTFHDFDTNPDTRAIEAGRIEAAAAEVDSLVAIGGGSSLDCAKGINFVLTNGGTMHDYRGLGKASRPMLPSIGVPTTAGTGSEAQSVAVISDADTHVKMACGDPKAAFRVAILDPAVTVTQPRGVSAVAGFDALSHAVESFVCVKRHAVSDLLAKDAWRRLEAHYARVLQVPDDVSARGQMLWGSHEAGLAIEHAMLGATHACANPLSARYGTVHGEAIAVMLPHVVRWNATVVGEAYGELLQASNADPTRDPGAALASRLEALARAGGLPATLRDLGVREADLPALADAAARQWTGTFNPRPFDASAALALYKAAF